MRVRALRYLGLSNQDWGPCYSDTFPYSEFSKNWRGAVKCPSEQEINDAYVASNTAQELDSEKTALATRECGKKELTAIVLWICKKLNITPSTAKAEIVAIWKGLP